MPRNTLAPGFIRLFQTTTIGGIGNDHSQDLGINPATWAGMATTITKKDGSTGAWDAQLTVFLNLWKVLFTVSTVFTGAELWRKDTPSSDPLYVATAILSVAGTGGGASQAAVQGVFSFKGTDDADMRLTTIEALRAHNARLAYTGMTAAEKALVDYVYGPTTWLYTRGNSYPASFGHLTTKVNDKLREKRLNL